MCQAACLSQPRIRVILPNVCEAATYAVLLVRVCEVPADLCPWHALHVLHLERPARLLLIVMHATMHQAAVLAQEGHCRQARMHALCLWQR